MRMYDIIADKRDGKELSSEQIEYFIKEYDNGNIPDYQASALLMAMFLQGLNEKEAFMLTDSMTKSGDVADLSFIKGVTVDKHSTGGVGDKTTLVLAPLVASCGLKMAKMSGRALGHTGGTVDKLDSIPGMRTVIGKDEFYRIVNEVGAAVVGKAGNFTPADKKLYALRDVTATVNSIPLIAASIMSKKLAAGAECIILDVKIGSGAFMKNIEQGEKLAAMMVDIGKRAGKEVSAVLTNMDRPLGMCIGNTLEVVEAVRTLKGEGPADLTELCIKLTGLLLEMSKMTTLKDGEEMARESIKKGLAFEKLCEMVKAQGGDENYIRNIDRFKKAKYAYEIFATESGYIQFMDTEKIGVAALLAGAGRNTKEEEIDYSAGIVLDKKTGDYVEKGKRLATIFSEKEAVLNSMEMYKSACKIGKEKKEDKALIFKIIN